MGIEIGWIDNEVKAEFPALDLRYVVVEAELVTSPPELHDQLLDMSTRFRGRHAMDLPKKPVPSAYRAFFRQVGLDPEAVRSPVEAIAYDRILRGTFASYNRVADALTASIVETHIALGALDADKVSEPLGIRPAADGALVIADADQVVAPLFGPPLPSFAASTHTRRIALTAVGVAGIHEWQLNYALWRVADLLGFDVDSE